MKTSPEVTERLKQSIETMREFLSELERDINRGDRYDEDIIQRAVHCFAWGQANASQGISNALSWLYHRKEMADSPSDRKER